MDILEEVNNLIAESEFAKAKHKLLQIMAENGTTLASTKLLGLVNVNLGCYDEARQNFEEVVQLDCEYIDNWSPLLDIKILFKTVWVVLKGSGAE